MIHINALHHIVDTVMALDNRSVIMLRHRVATGALLIACLTAAPALSQTREETVEFLFRGGRIEMPHGKIYVGKDATIKEDSCVVDIKGKIDGSRYLRYSIGKAPNPLVALGGHDYHFRIDFNKLLPVYLQFNSGKYGINLKILGEDGAVEAVVPEVVNANEILAMGANYSGNPRPQLDASVTDSSSDLFVGYLDSDVGERKTTRLPNAFKYFISNFCAGKKSAY